MPPGLASGFFKRCIPSLLLVVSDTFLPFSPPRYVYTDTYAVHDRTDGELLIYLHTDVASSSCPACRYGLSGLQFSPVERHMLEESAVKVATELYATVRVMYSRH